MNIFGFNLIFNLNKKTISQGKDNKINISSNIKCAARIIGDNNIVDITAQKTKSPKKIKINIKGNNNKIIIKNLETGNIFIDIGNYTGVNNSVVEIENNFGCVQMKILAYQHNTPIKIGENCMFSSGVTIRSGELPHVIYDINTREDLDKSEGVYIGNLYG